MDCKVRRSNLEGIAFVIFPSYFAFFDLFSERHTYYYLRDSFRELNLPKPGIDNSKRSFGCSGALMWNYFPENIRAIRSIGQFKKEINRALETFDSHWAIL